jgi:hypothetical protein
MPSDAPPSEPFYLVIADHRLGLFSVEGPMTDDQPWASAVRRARDSGRRVASGPTGPDRDALAAEFQRTYRFGGVPPGSIVRPRT